MSSEGLLKSCWRLGLEMSVSTSMDEVPSLEVGCMVYYAAAP